MDLASPTHGANLAIPFGLLGGTGSYLVATVLARRLDFSAFDVACFALPTMASVCIGLWHSHRADRSRPVGWGSFFSSLFLGGTLAGGLIGATASREEGNPWWALGGAAFGFCMTLLFLPALSAAFLAWKQIGMARSHSIADASIRQRLWSVTALGLTLYAYGMLSFPVLDPPDAPKWVGVYLVLIAMAMTGWGLSAEVRRHAWLRRLEKGLVPGRAEPVDESTTLDLGLGDEAWSSDSPKPHPYRAAPFPVLTVRGSPAVVATAVRKSILIHVAALGGSLLVGSSIVGVISERAPERDGLDTAKAPVEVAEPPAPSCRHASWYNGRPPILVDVNGDGVEDIVGLRWNSSKEDHRLAVAAIDGRSLSEIWCDDSIASQWGSPHTRLVRSGQTLYLTDSEGLLHIYSLATGKENVAALAVPSIFEAVATGDDALWYWPGGSFDQGVIVHPDGRVAPGRRPSIASAVIPAMPGSCVGADHVPPGRWKLVPTQGGPRDIAYLRDAPALPGSDPKQPEIVGVDRETCGVMWRRSVALDTNALHRHPQVDLTAHADRIFVSHQLQDGAWRVGARDGKTGDLLWFREPTRTDRGSSFHSLTASATRLYVVLEWRLDVFDAATGELVGAIP